MKELKSLWKKLSDLGTGPEQSPQLSGSVRLSNQAAFLVAFLSTLYLITELFFFSPQHALKPFYFYGMQVALIVILALVLVLNFLKRTLMARLLFCIVLPISLLPNSYALNQPLRAEFYMYGIAASNFLFFSQTKIIAGLFLIPVMVLYLMVLNFTNQFPTIYILDTGTFLRIGLSFLYIYLAMNLLRNKNNRYESELKNLNKTKDKILSIVSHDLRSPVASLRALVQMLDSSQISQDEFKQLVKKLNTKVESLHDTLENLLHWSYAQSNGMKISPEVFNLDKLIRETIQLLSLNADSKGISIVLQGNLNFEVLADVTMIRSILINLISNSIKFTPTGGFIKISVAPDNNNMLKVMIQDSGRGMTQEMVNSRFQPTTDFSLPGTNNEHGTGLGLQLCKEFAEKNKGAISVRSEVGKGSEFSFTTPLASSLINS